MKLVRIPPERLEVGMTVAIRTVFSYGWSEYTGLTKYDFLTISRITPKRTRVYCGENEYVVRKTTFYTPSPEMDVENKRVKAFLGIIRCMDKIREYSAKRFIDSLDEMEVTEELLKTLLARAKSSEKETV